MLNSHDTIFILGGHQLSYSYFEKLMTARTQGRIVFHMIQLVDDDKNCFAVTALGQAGYDPEKYVIRKSYPDFILSELSENNQEKVLIPDHTAKHFMLQVFMDLAKDHTPELQPVALSVDTPFCKKFENDAVWALSHATWLCPLYCDEPEICPHTKGKRDWDLGKLFLQDNVFCFSCEPLVDEIVSLSLTQIAVEVAAFQKQLAADLRPLTCVFTHSHCHGILGCFCCTK